MYQYGGVVSVRGLHAESTVYLLWIGHISLSLLSFISMYFRTGTSPTNLLVMLIMISQKPLLEFNK